MKKQASDVIIHARVTLRSVRPHESKMISIHRQSANATEHRPPVWSRRNDLVPLAMLRLAAYYSFVPSPAEEGSYP